MISMSTYFIVIILYSPQTGEKVTKTSLPQRFTQSQCIKIIKNLLNSDPSLEVSARCIKFKLKVQK